MSGLRTQHATFAMTIGIDSGSQKKTEFRSYMYLVLESPCIRLSAYFRYSGLNPAVFDNGKMILSYYIHISP